MEILIQQFYDGLASEDDLGMILRGHLHIEHQLKEFISLFLPYSQKCDWDKISFLAKLELALSCGLPEDMRKLIEKINCIRNSFAHELNADIEKKTVLNLYNCLSLRHSDVVKLCNKELGRNEQFRPAKLDQKELLQIILVCTHSAIQAEILEKKKLAKA